MKVKIFIDFWNLQLSWNEYHSKIGATIRVKIPWEKTLPEVLISRIGKDATYSGTHVYASINPKSSSDRKLQSFLQNMDLFSGYKVIIKERKSAKPIRCSNDGCRREISVCPLCNKELIRTVEKATPPHRLTTKSTTPLKRTGQALPHL